jgi:hypothetical protein
MGGIFPSSLVCPSEVLHLRLIKLIIKLGGSGSEEAVRRALESVGNMVVPGVLFCLIK